MNPLTDHRRHVTRREFFGRAAAGIGTAALRHLLGRDGLAADAPTGALPGLPHFAPKAKRVIYLFQNGAPTHVDLFDYKPQLAKLHGKPVPESFVAGKRFSTMTGSADGQADARPGRAVQAARQERRLGQRLPAAHRDDRRRAVLRQVDAHRAR